MEANKTAAAYFDSGKILFLQKIYDAAIAEFEKAVNIDEKFADAHYYWGLSILNRKKAEKISDKTRSAFTVFLALIIFPAAQFCFF